MTDEFIDLQTERLAKLMTKWLDLAEAHLNAVSNCDLSYPEAAMHAEAANIIQGCVHDLQEALGLMPPPRSPRKTGLRKRAIKRDTPRDV